jgi:hypothetical protein
MLAMSDHCRTAADVRAAIAASQAWRCSAWGKPTTAEPRPAHPPYRTWVAPARVAPTPPPLPTAAEASKTHRIIKAILAAVSERYDVPIDKILGRSRLGNIVRARQMAAYLVRTNTPLSLPQIGKWVFRRDHTTILHAVRTVSGCVRRRAVAEEIAAVVAAALEQVEGDAS